MKICVLIRVYNRLEDLGVCVETIRKYWQSNDYHVIAISNGVKAGFLIPAATKRLCDQVVELADNPGHIGGNSQLLMEGAKCVPDDCPYTLILESDTWVLSDAIIARYVNLMEEQGVVWASAEWIERFYSLALDFAIIDTKFMKANPEIFNFKENAEKTVCNYLMDHNAKYVYVRENMPTHLPRAMKFFFSSFSGRMKQFTASKMVTHHLEDLKGGIEEKRRLANIAAGGIFFETGDTADILKEHCKLKWIERLVRIFPRSRWFRTKKRWA